MHPWLFWLPEGLQVLNFGETIYDNAGSSIKKLTALQAGLGVAISFPDTIHRIPQIADQLTGQEYPRASDIFQRLITLPVHQYLAETDKLKISAMMKDKIYGQR